MTARAARRPLLGLALALLGSCGRQPGPGGEIGARRDIEAAVQRYVEASNRGDAEGLASLYADDAVLLPPDHQPVRGRAAIGDFWREGTDEGLEVTTLTVEVDGNLGYLVGRYRLPATDEEPADSGKYVMCLKRQRDGAWKLTADIWNRSGDDKDTEEGRKGPSIS
ncbi:MAG: SgcJ/EcaC family oxidoreductase [Chloroflexota bacterium]